MNVFSQKLALKNLNLDNRVYLAPLAGVTDVPFRRICQELGAGLTYVEMLSATAIIYNNKRTFSMMARHASEKVLGVQLTGSCSEHTAKAIEILAKEGFETIDINMGCPVRKVVANGCGSAILKDLERLKETVTAARQATNLPLSAKIRLGYTRELFNVTQTADIISKAGFDQLTIHGRTRSESYETPVDRSGIALGFQHVCQSQVRIGNGDLFSAEDARKMMKETGSDGVMVSRGALGNPWIFRDILEGQSQQPTVEEWFDVVSRHVSYHVEHYGQSPLSAILLRKHLLWYTKGFPGSKAAREKFNKIETIEEANQALKDFYLTVCSAGKVEHSGGEFDGKSTRRFGGNLQASNIDSFPVDSSYDPKYEMDRINDRGVGHLEENQEA